MSKYLPFFVAGLLFLLASGCATPPPKIEVTRSGKPEVTIATSNLSEIKSLIINDLVDVGYSVESDTEYSLTLSRQLKGTENFGAAMTVGNSYSTNTRVSSYTFAKTDGSIRVVASTGWRAQMPGGQTRITPLEDGAAQFNIFQEQLNGIKLSIESRRPADSPPVAVTH